MKISVMHSNLKRPFDEVLDICVELGLDGIHYSCKELDARTSPAADRKEYLDKIKARGLEVSALCCWGGQVDLGDREKHAENIAWGKQILELAIDLETTIWQAHVGVMPWSTDDPRWSAFVDACGEIAAYGETLGACLAMETGPEPARIMQRLIETVDSPGLRCNYDPANLILWPVILRDRGLLATPYDKAEAIAEFEPNEGVKRLGQYTVHTHAKDAIVTAEGKRQEVPLGQGFVDWQRYLGLLKESGYEGYLAIERETGEDPVGDIRRAATFLREQLAQLG